MRDFGLGVVDRLPGLKSYFIGHAAGTTDAGAPRLLAGEAL
jgi:2-octaprenyl-6-methoxyphenol hydroxylase